ncbi:WD40 repeat domain-containing protein [Nocardia sp. NPDC052566]|uniref:WD40 repeat domain-containing protein n=1 Tax=Nocardia sp. NPDC052566 TaxID=3364330 RepID=UPI0037CA2C33
MDELLGRAVETGGWAEVAGSPLLDQLDPDDVVAAVLRSGVRWADLPVEVAAILGVRHQLGDLGEGERALVRQVAGARFVGTYPRRSPQQEWHLRWSRQRRDPLHIVLGRYDDMFRLIALVPADGRTMLAGNGFESREVWLRDPVDGGEYTVRHSAKVVGLAAVPWSDGRTLLATAGGKTIRFWDPSTGDPVGAPRKLPAAATAMTAVRLPDDRTVLAVSSDDVVRMMEPETGAPYGSPIHRHSKIHALGAIELDGQALLVVAESYSGVNLFDPVTGHAVQAPFDLPYGASVATVPGPDGRGALATGNSEVILLLDTKTGEHLGSLTGHGNSVRAVAAVPMPGGRTLLASASFDDTLRLWDPSGPLSSETSHSWPMTNPWATNVASARLGNRPHLASVSGDERAVRFWDLDTSLPVGTPLPGGYGRMFLGPPVPLPDGRTLVTTSDDDRVITFRDPETAQVVSSTPPGHGSDVALAPVPLPDGRTLLASGAYEPFLWDSIEGTARRLPMNRGSIAAMVAVPVPGGTVLAAARAESYRQFDIIRWDLGTGELITHQLIKQPLSSLNRVRALAALPASDGRTLLAYGDDNGVLGLADPLTGAPECPSFTDGASAVVALAAVPLPTGRYLLACASETRMIRLWDETGTLVAKLSGHRGRVRALAVLPDGKLVSAGDDATVRVWDPVAAAQVGPSLPTGPAKVLALAAVDGARIATGDENGALRLWDLAQATAIGAPMLGHSGQICALITVEEEGHPRLVSGDGHGSIMVWDPDTGVSRQLTGHADPVFDEMAAVTMPDGSTAVAAAGRGIGLWDPLTGRLIGTPFPGQRPIVALPGADGLPLVASRNGRGDVVLHDPITGDQVGRPMRGHGGAITAVAAIVAPNGRALLVTGGDDGTVRLWDPVRGIAIGEPLAGHKRSVWHLVVIPIPGSVLLASATLQGDAIKFWDVATGACRTTLPLDSPIHSMAVCADRLAVGCDNGILMLERVTHRE